MSINPYSLEISNISINKISKEVIKHYCNKDNYETVEKVLNEIYPDGISFQAWYTFDKGFDKDIKIKAALYNNGANPEKKEQN